MCVCQAASPNHVDAAQDPQLQCPEYVHVANISTRKNTYCAAQRYRQESSSFLGPSFSGLTSPTNISYSHLMCPIASVMESENQLAANMFTRNQEIRMRWLQVKISHSNLPTGFHPLNQHMVDCDLSSLLALYTLLIQSQALLQLIHQFGGSKPISANFKCQSVIQQVSFGKFVHSSVHSRLPFVLLAFVGHIPQYSSSMVRLQRLHSIVSA